MPADGMEVERVRGGLDGAQQAERVHGNQLVVEHAKIFPLGAVKGVDRADVGP